MLNLGSGPGRSMLDYLNYNSQNVHFDCIDHDSNAIAHAQILNAKYHDRINYYCCNAFKFSSRNRYHVIWCSGLFDYLSDKAFKILLRKYLRLLVPGGEIIIGNFSARNPSKEIMACGGWFLNHRTDEHLITLAQEAGVSRDCIFIEKEPTGVNLFMHIQNI